MITSTPKDASVWGIFWKKKHTGFDFIMHQATMYFTERLNQMFPPQKTDRFLDIGCGPGFLISYLKDKCDFIHGTDISENYIETCQRQFSQDKNVSLSVSGAYDFEAYCRMIEQYRINRVVMLSVLQYYESKNEVRELILSLKKVSTRQKFNCILSDIIPETGHTMWDDVISVAAEAVKKGYPFQFIKFMFSGLFSGYLASSRKKGSLSIDPSFFIALAKELDIEIQVVKKLTMHAARYSVVLQF